MRQPAVNNIARVHISPRNYVMSSAVVMSGPSGGGKSTLLNKLFEQYPKTFAFSVSHTTRDPRPGEENGVHYHFISRDKMQKAIDDGQFLEHATFGGNMYGTSKKAVEDIQSSGRVCILDVDLQGVRAVKKSAIPAKYIFVKPPSMQVLEKRLKGRGTENDSSLNKRLDHAKDDEKAVNADPTLFDHVIINDDVEKAYESLLKALENQINSK